MEGPHGDSISVAIVEDQNVIRDGLGLLIDGTLGFRCSGSFGGMEEALPRLERNPPDVLLVDLGLPGMSGTEGIRRLSERCPDLPMLVLAVYDDDERIFDAVLAGACGYVLKTAAADTMLALLRAVVDGGAPMSPEVARRVLELWRGGEPPRLATEEMSILEKLAEGHVYETASAELKLSAREIGRKMRRIYDRIHLRTARTPGVHGIA